MIQKISEVLRQTPGMKAKDLAKKLNIDKHQINSLLYNNSDSFEIDANYCWSLRKTEFRVEFAASWIDADSFESALIQLNSLRVSVDSHIVFIIPKGCKLLLEAIARLMAIANQMAYEGRDVTLDFSQQYSTLTYVNRLGFFDHLDKKINVLPHWPKTSAAITYKNNSATLVEIATIDPVNPDESIPPRLKTVFVEVAGDKYDQTAFTILSELFGNVRDHAESKIPGFIGLQYYGGSTQPHIQTVISDSGKGILGTLKPILPKKYPEVVREIENSGQDFDTELMKRVITKGHLSQSYDEGRGLGLLSSGNAASKFNAKLSIRQLDCEVTFHYQGGKLKKVKSNKVPPLLQGTHICFDFSLTD